MTKKLFSFLVSELKTVRVICKNRVCGAITELPVEQVERVFQDPKCPVCGMHLSGGEGGLALLGSALRILGASKDKVEVEFAVPVAD